MAYRSIAIGKKCYVNTDEPLKRVDSILQAAGQGTVRVQGDYGYDMLAGFEDRQRISEGRQDKILWFTPGWLKNWQMVYQKYFGWDEADANANFPGFYDKIIVLDGLGLAEEYMIQHADGDNLWGLPGGGMELGERAAETVVREVREEIGLEVQPVALIGVYSSPEYAFACPNGDQVQAVMVFFECRVMGGELRPYMEEIIGARYFGPEDELPPMRPCCVAKARDAFVFRGQAFFR